MFLCCWLALGALIPLTLATDPGVKVKLTAKGLEYGTDRCNLPPSFGKALIWNLPITFPCLFLLGRQLGMAAIQKKLKTIRVPDISGKASVSPIGTVQYSLTK